MSKIEVKRKEEIFEAAIKVFNEKGYHNTTMEDIIAQTNLSKGGVYYYFKNKQDLFINLLYDATVRYNDISTNLEDYDSNNNPIKNVCDYYLNYLINDTEEIAIISSIYIDTRYDLNFRKKIADKFETNNVEYILRYIKNHCVVEDETILKKKIIYFMDIFHSMLYYKYIEKVNYIEQKEFIEDMFLSIFSDLNL